MSDFLLELRSEEIPARMQAKASADLARLFAEEIAKAGLAAAAIETYATPRRLALIARGLPAATDATVEEVKGPRADAPAQALAGFLGKTGLARDQLVERTDAKGNAVLFAVIERQGRATEDVLAAAIPVVIRAFPWPKSMRWGAASASAAALRWVRPLHGIVALFGEAVVACEVDGIVSGAATFGHRFHHPGPITIGGADDYAAKLRACHVILDPAERRAIIAEGAARAAAAAGLAVVPDEGLVAENAGLTEWPVPLLGRFDPAFLAVPREVIQLTMRTNQKYFALVDGDGALAPAFVCTANIDANDGGAAIVAGNEKVLAARLADAKFFWEQDLKVPLGEWAGKLDRIVFHEKLGTVADKVERVVKLARWLVEEGIVGASPSPPAGEGRGEGAAPVSDATPVAGSHPLSQPSPARGEGYDAALADMAEQAARLCKADLVTGMVGEFPELQGVMGGYYARAGGLPDAVADAIRDHYKPVGQGDEVPTAPVTVAVSLADKLDTVAAFFAIDEKPTGSKDPFALRRAMLGALSIFTQNNIRLRLSRFIIAANDIVGRTLAQRSIAHFPEPFRHYWKTYFEAIDRSEPLFRQPDLIYTSTLFDTQYSPETSAIIDIVASAYRSVDLDKSRIVEFAADRLKVQQREAGVRHDLIDAVFALGGEDDLVRLLARVQALQAFVATDDGVNLLAGYKRAANILRIEERKDGAASTTVIAADAGIHSGGGASGEMDPGVRRDDGAGGEYAQKLGLERAADAASDALEPAEAALVAALDVAEPAAAGAVAAEDFAGAMRALAALRVPIDAFFDQVVVNDPDPERRLRRLGLLDRIRAAMHNVADFSKIEG